MSEKRVKQIRQSKMYSEELRLHVVSLIENGELSVAQAMRSFDIKAKQTIYDWLYRYSRTLKKGIRVVMESDSLSKKLSDLEKRNKDLESALGRKQLELELYMKLVELASKELKVDIKKNFGQK
jgi:transposase